MRDRLLREERGFTMTEVMVTLIIMLIVLFSLYGIFDMGLRVFSFGNSEVEATENARLGLEKMDREIQAAYATDKGAADTDIFENAADWEATRIRFGNDLDGNRRIACPNADIPPRCEKIGYQVFESPVGKYVLGRDNSAAGTSLQPVVEHVDYVSATNTGLALAYFKADGVTPTSVESEVAVVRIELRIRVKNGFGDGTQTLTTDVALRNRGG